MSNTTFSTYHRGVRQGHATTSIKAIQKRLAKLATAPQADPDDLVGVEVRVRLPNGSERLCAVVAQHGENLVLATIDGDQAVIASVVRH